MKTTIIAALIAAIAIGSALGAFAATRTIETEADVHVRVWRSVSTGDLYLSTRPGDGEWTTHSTPLDMSARSDSGRFDQSNFVTITVPLTVEVDVPDPEPEPTPTTTTTTTTTPTPAPTAEAEPGTCCEVRGMESLPAAGEQVVAEIQRVIELGDRRYGLTHSGPITINISFTSTGIGERYRQAFGYRPETLPDECSFQREEHMFFTPQCRSSTDAIAKEWFTRATGVPDIEPRWIMQGTEDFFVTLAVEGREPTLTGDRFQRAVFYERPEELATGRASQNLETTAMLYAISRYGTPRNWLNFYERVAGGEDVTATFEDAFGETLDAFYVAFGDWAEAERLLLLTSAYDSCDEAARQLKPRGGTPGVDAGFPDYRVPAAADHDGDGIVCEGHLPGQ